MDAEQGVPAVKSSALTVVAPDQVFNNIRSLRYSVFDTLNQYPVIGGPQTLVKCINVQSQWTGASGTRGAVPSFEVIGEPGLNQTIRCIVQNDVELTQSVENKPTVAYVCGPKAYISSSAADVNGAVTEAKYGQSVATAADVIQLASAFAPMSGPLTAWDWKKLLSAVNPIFQLGEAGTWADLVSTIIPPAVDFNRMAFWLRAWMLYHSLVQLETLQTVNPINSTTIIMRDENEAVSVHVYPLHLELTTDIIARRAKLMLYAQQFDWVVAVGNDITWDMVATLRAGASQAPFLSIAYADRATRSFRGEKQRPIASQVPIEGRKGTSKLIIISDVLFNETKGWPRAPVIGDDFRVDTLPPYFILRWPLKAKLAYCAIQRVTLLMHDRCASVDGFYLATLLSYVIPIRANFSTLDQCDTIRNDCQAYTEQLPPTIPIPPAAPKRKGGRRRGAQVTQQQLSEAMAQHGVAAPRTRATTRRANATSTQRSQSPEDDFTFMRKFISVDDYLNTPVSSATRPRSVAEPSPTPTPGGSVVPEEAVEPQEQVADSSDDEFGSDDDYLDASPARQHNCIVVLYLNGFHCGTDIQIPRDVMRPPLALLFSAERDASVYSLLVHPDWSQITRMTDHEVLRMALSMVCQFGVAKAEAMYASCIRWIDYYMGSLSNGANVVISDDYQPQALAAATEIMFEGLSLGSPEMPSALTDAHYSTLLHATWVVVPVTLYANVRFTPYLLNSQLERILIHHKRLLHRATFGPDLVLPYACSLAYDNPFALVSDRYRSQQFVEYPLGVAPNGKFNTIIRSLLGRNSLFVADQDRIGFMNGLVSQTPAEDIRFNIYTRSILSTDGLGVRLARQDVAPKMFRDARGQVTTFVRPGFFQTFEGRGGLFRFFEYKFSAHETPDWLNDSSTRTFLDRGAGYGVRLNDLCRSILSLPQASNTTFANGVPRKKHRMAPTVGVIEAAGRDYLDAR